MKHTVQQMFVILTCQWTDLFLKKRQRFRHHFDLRHGLIIAKPTCGDFSIHVFIFQDNTRPIMCSYKLVKVSFDVWGLRDKVQQYVQRVCRVIFIFPFCITHCQTYTHVCSDILGTWFSKALF